MSNIQAAAIAYLSEPLYSENQKRISVALRKHQSGEFDRAREFNIAIKKKVADKEAQYDTFMNNLAMRELPPEIVSDIGRRMKALKDEMGVLLKAEPPKDFTTEQIEAWLNSLKNAPDEKAIRLLIERIDVITKTDFNITSTLKSVVRENGCGGGI